MTAIAERRIAVEKVCYEVYCPESGQILGYVKGNGVALAEPLGEALARNGFRLVTAGSRAAAGPPADLLR